ncbi:MAG: bifunctional glutamate N-acetyltransferase/amino-acid acetyltransferase ArgJ [Nitrospirae bacterium]|nr:bifunctional glutamate N-acetyltransferase/amino-acid acetyltransferase ArgJ [Nitrospirota bacterium]
MQKNRSTIIPGFKFASVSANIKTPGKKDLAIIFSENVAAVAGVFTTNRIKAAPVMLDIARIKSHKGRAIIVNSGNANACTGRQGLEDAKTMVKLTAGELGIEPGSVYVASTGVIGRPLPMEKIRTALPGLAKELSSLSMQDVASAIMTTDTFAKTVFRKIKIAGKAGTVAGMAKGAGMICPNMATLLSFIVTDIAVEPKTLDKALRQAVRKSFNRLIIDNDMSTNDTVLIMANGILKNRLITKSSPDYDKFEDALSDVTYSLAKMIARDGEGATKLIEVIVKGARTEADAEKAARAVANSLLVKTAIYGNDPNWGRILAAIGYSGAKINEQKISLSANNCKLFDKGIGAKNIRKDIFSKKDIIITADLGLGKKEAKVLTCDLTEGYIKINASYTT